MAPVDLFSFYIYMRDQQKSVDYLDFWLDVSQHLSLCRHYVRRLHRSVIEDTPELEKETSKRSSVVLDNAGEGPSGDKATITPDQRLSAFLRSDHGSRQHSPQNSHGSNKSTQSTPAMERPRPSFMTADSNSPANDSSPGQDSSGPDNVPKREDLRASAEKILYTYLLPGSEREIIIPQGILHDVQEAIEGPAQRSDPELFDAAKDYVFQAMERDAFPGFLKSKALGNLVPPSMMLRLIVGLLAMFGGFWAAFILIFLNEPRHIRCWLILPFTIGTYALTSQQYMLDPILVFAGFSEYTFMSFVRIREPYVKKLLRSRRASMALGLFILIDTATCCLFIFVPGKRL
jgi:hypothetical protein